ncbi:MAG: SIS domain-containing protein [Proteobacteria bacterium]|nr:SIS domain-containing protein [Pseudomonadota bacterium]
MNFFPDRLHPDAAAYAEAYFEQVRAAHATVDRVALNAAANILTQTVRMNADVFSCGNGGSAAISNHLLCDCLKGVANGTFLRPRVHSLASAVELITAISNDLSVEEIFAFPLSSLAKAGDLLIVISSSGASRNIVRALETAAEMGVRTIALTGFDGGQAAQMADVSLHVDCANYGVVEDVHQSLMHILAQNIRHANLADSATLGRVRF